MNVTFPGPAVRTCKVHGWQFDLPAGRCLTAGEPSAVNADGL